MRSTIVELESLPTDIREAISVLRKHGIGHTNFAANPINKPTYVTLTFRSPQNANEITESLSDAITVKLPEINADEVFTWYENTVWGPRRRTCE